MTYAYWNVDMRIVYQSRVGLLLSFKYQHSGSPHPHRSLCRDVPKREGDGACFARNVASSSSNIPPLADTYVSAGCLR